jgi:hypothetical protein
MAAFIIMGSERLSGCGSGIGCGFKMSSFLLQAAKRTVTIDNTITLNINVFFILVYIG